MFRIESYITPILLSYVDKYVRDFKPADAQLSLWGGGVTLHNLVLKADVLQHELSLPFTLVSGRIHELLIQVPWTKIMSEPIVVTINTIECVLNLNPPELSEDYLPPNQYRPAVVEQAPPGYGQALVRRVVSNIAIRVNSLIVKCVHDDVVLSLNVKHLSIDSVGSNWKPAFTELDTRDLLTRRLVSLDDLTLCLDRSDSDGKIRHYQEPLLYRCQLEIRILMSLQTPHSRVARNLSVQLRSSSLEWGVTSEQLVLLLRLLRERPQPPPTAPSQQMPAAYPPAAPSQFSSIEQPQDESWSEWAWSWMPFWAQPEDAEEAVHHGKPFPIMFTAFLDKVTFVYKLMETEVGSNRRRARPLLEMTAQHCIVTYLVVAPTVLRLRLGAHIVVLGSQGKCVCGHLDVNALQDKPTVYLKPNYQVDEAYNWPKCALEMQLLDPELYVRHMDQPLEEQEAMSEDSDEVEVEDEEFMPNIELNAEPPIIDIEEVPFNVSPEFVNKDSLENLWLTLSPAFYLEYEHDREPPFDALNPFENPPRNFENSDWVEKATLCVAVRPMVLRVCTGLVHRLEIMHELLQDLPPVEKQEIVIRPLTVEECDALTNNTPERSYEFKLKGLEVHITPFDHSLTDQPTEPVAAIEVYIKKISLVLTGAMYPNRVCAAACQMPDKMTELYGSANLRVSFNILGAVGRLTTPTARLNRPIFKFTVFFRGQYLMNKHLFEDYDAVYFGGTFTMPYEVNVCLTAAAMDTAVEIARSLRDDRVSTLLRDTTLADDAMEERDTTAVEGVMSRFVLIPRLCKSAALATITVQSIKVTGIELKNGLEENVAWLFSAPDRNMVKEWTQIRFQYCLDPTLEDALDFLFVETEVCAVSLDPLLMNWLTYRPRMRPPTKPISKAGTVKSMSSSKYFIRRRTTPPSSGRGSRAGSAAEFVHVRTRSADSPSERSERTERQERTNDTPPKKEKLQGKKWDNEAVLRLYNRLRHLVLKIELGLVMVYTTTSTTSALETSSVQDAMERAVGLQRVLVFNAGRWEVISSGPDLSESTRYDRPTFLLRELQGESFPWRVKISDVSSYTLETCPLNEEDRGFIRQRAQSRTTERTVPRTMLDAFTSTMTISVVTKTADSRQNKRQDPKKPPPTTQDDQKQKYFTSGIDFTPMTLRDYVRGPSARPGTHDGRGSPEPHPDANPEPQSLGDGPLISLGLCIHGDTPPIFITLRQDQVHIVRAAFHCLAHMKALLKKQRTPIPTPRPKARRPDSAPIVRSPAMVGAVCNVSEQRSSSEETPSENPFERLIPIFESRSPTQDKNKLRTFVWFQWVMNRASVAFVTDAMMISLVIEDAICTIDMQEHYEQLRLKISTGTLLHFTHKPECSVYDLDRWEPGALGGRVMETRESADGKSVNFFATTVTRAKYGNLPASWREELNMKRLRQNIMQETMWEVFITVAPLEFVLHPQVIRGLTLIGKTLLLQSFCPVQLDNKQECDAAQQTESQQSNMYPMPMPFMHIDLGGMRIILNAGAHKTFHDDTFIIQIGIVAVLPNPDNPICRRSINTVGEANWIPAASGCDGRQHELIIKSVSVRTARIQQLLTQMMEYNQRSHRNMNPAANWAEPPPRVSFVPILHNVEVHGVIAPPVFMNGELACGPALEINVPSDVTVELSVEQVGLLNSLLTRFYDGFTKLRESEDETPSILEVETWCPFSQLLVYDVEGEDDVEGVEVNESAGGVSDSGLESQPSTSRMDPVAPSVSKKSVSIAIAERPLGPYDHVEVFVVMGRIDAALYVRNGRAVAAQPLRMPTLSQAQRDKRHDDCGPSIKTDLKLARRGMNCLPAIHITLYQPNMYYWRKVNVRGMQCSLFNAWVAFGEGQDERRWHRTLLGTKAGAPDPDTDIPPSLASARLDSQPASSVLENPQWSMCVDIERPVIIDINDDSLERLLCIANLLSEELGNSPTPPTESNPFNRVHLLLTNRFLEKLTVNAGQLALRWSPWTAAVDELRLQLGTARHPDRLCIRALLSALLLTSDRITSQPPVDERRHLILQPVMVGLQAEASWLPSATGERNPFTSQPTVRIAVEMDDVAVDVRPVDTNHADAIIRTIRHILKIKDGDEEARPGSGPSVSRAQPRVPDEGFVAAHEVYYKDDLKNGVFKVTLGEQARMPMAYEVSAQGSAIVWNYHVPRFIARIIALPLPGCDEEVDCVLESYNRLLGRWEPHTHFQIPVTDSKEYRMARTDNDKVFQCIWRVRPIPPVEENVEPFEFRPGKYMPQDDPVIRWSLPAEEWPVDPRVTAEQLLGSLQVDSYLSGFLAPRSLLACRFGALALHAHTAQPPDPPTYPGDIDLPHFEGIFVSPALRRAHRGLSLVTRNATVNVVKSAGNQLMTYECHLGVDIYESETGTMERLVEDFRLQGSITYATQLKIRMRAGDVRVMMNAPRVRTLRMMMDDWYEPYERFIKEEEFWDYEEPYYDREVPLERDETVMYTWNTDRLKVIESSAKLDGRVYLYVVNTCDAPLRFGQKGTDEVLTVNARATHAYRWNSPLAPKKLRFALWGTGNDFHWSMGIPYKTGMHRVRLEDEGEPSTTRARDGVFLYARVEDADDRMLMHIGGRIVLGNMLKEDLTYKIRIRDPTAEDGMRVIASGDIRAHCIGLTVLCSTATKDAYIKIKFEDQVNGWTGDIPLKECPKEHVPWLVKVPATGEVPCVSVWCRVERTRADSRINVIFFPLFIMRSHLPLDINVAMKTDPMGEEDAALINAPILRQAAAGRGHITQLKTLGTTIVRHSLTFQYKSLVDCEVTQEKVALHYSMTESPVFDTYAPPSYAEDMIVDALNWLNTFTSEADREWPYSPVRTHWPGTWRATISQPRCDILIRYKPLKCCGGGCGMVMHVMPRVLVCNAAGATLTVRDDNAAPLCRLEPGCVSAPPSDIIAYPFYVSCDDGSSVNLSEELSVSHEELGVYGQQPAGWLALDRSTDVVVCCDDRVAFLTMYYTMYMEIHVFGLTSTFLFLNKLNTEILISPAVVQNLPEVEETTILRPKHFKKVKTCRDDLTNGVRVTHFWLFGRYVHENARHLRAYLCFALPDEDGCPSATPVPVLLGREPLKRAIALIDLNGDPLPVVVTQMKHEGRWVVTASLDQSPQFAVHNHTGEPLALGHPVAQTYDPYSNNVTLTPEASGVKWCYILGPNQRSFYSTTPHMQHTSCPRRRTRNPDEPNVVLLTVGRVLDEREHETEWSAPLMVLEGDHLVQLSRDARVKLRVQLHPHSTELHLLQCDESDVSASEIRQRLVKGFGSMSYDMLMCREHSRARLQHEIKLMQRQWQEDVLSALDDAEEAERRRAQNEEETPEDSSTITMTQMDLDSETSIAQDEIDPAIMLHKREEPSPATNDWLRWVAGRVVVELATRCAVSPLVRTTAERVAFMLHSDVQTLYQALTVGDFQVDNMQHDTQRYDFAVVATTSAEPRADERFPPLWGMLIADRAFDIRVKQSKVVLRLTYDKWRVEGREHQQLCDVDLFLGPTSLYVEDAFMHEASRLARLLAAAPELSPPQLVCAEAASLAAPLRLRLLYVHELNITLTLHTAYRLYISLERSPLQMAPFRLENMVTTPDKLMHDFTVHYLSGIILGAGWLVGGLGMLGAPGALAVRVARARGGMRGMAAAAGAGLLRSVNSCAGSLARNLDLLAGDDDHTQRAAVARRINPPTFMAGISAGITHFAVNILGAVGGLAHHPLVGVAVGEASGALALRRGLVGALAKPLSATADLVAFAGQGLLTQTGWDPDPQQRQLPPLSEPLAWRRDCVRWVFRLHTLPALFGVDATLEDEPVRLVVTDKFLVVAEPTTERIVEMIDYRFCKLVSFDGQVVEIRVTQRRPHNRETPERSVSEIMYPQASSAAMARVAAYTGVSRGEGGAGHTLRLRTARYHAPALAAALAVALRQDRPTHLHLL